MSETLTYTGTLVIEECHCGVKHAIPEQLQREARHEGKTVYCPLGHGWVYGESTQKKLARAQEALEKERLRVKATRELLHQEERSHAATRGHVTRKKKELQRVKAGVCPCCTRHFTNLERHMASKHPSFKP